MKPPLSKKQTHQKTSDGKSASPMKGGSSSVAQGASLKPINVFKSSLAPSGLGVTSEVTKTKIDNGSNCSDNQPLLDRKRDKKKKKKKDREERHKKRNFLQ